MSKHPLHKEPIRPKRRAVAPYNFVPLPEHVIRAEDAGGAQVTGKTSTPHLVRHDSYHTGRHTGQITATLITRSPLYTRTGLTPEAFATIAEKPFEQLSEADKDRYAAFFALNTIPTIPGSSLRGMLRTLIEIVAQSKVGRVMSEKPFFRTLTDRATKDIYYNYFLEKVTPPPRGATPCYKANVHAGFFRHTANGYTIEACDWGRIDRSAIPGRPRDLYQGSGPNRIPNWQYQYQTIYVQLDPISNHFFPAPQPSRPGRKPRHPDLYLRFRNASQASWTATTGLQEGVLVLTGDMQNKHLEFVFLRQTNTTYPLPDDLVRRFHDDDQITLWQQKAFPKTRPSTSQQPQPGDGMLQDGDPIFFLLDSQDKVVFFGRAQNFRLPYPHSPRDFVPPELRDPNITDLAEALFGYVPTDDGDRPDQRPAYAGRVFVDDAPLDDTQRGSNIWLTDDPQSYLVPRILSGPKPTTFQHYLVQPNDDRSTLKHYASTPETETVIRGHKLYWHQRHTDDWTGHLRNPDTQPGEEGSQHTGLRPVKPDTRFALCIRFENLSDCELGALLWVLRLVSIKDAAAEQYALKLGMGKSLGMGSAQIKDLTVHTSDRKQRYTELFAKDKNNNDTWATGAQSQDEQVQETYLHAFQAYVQQHSGETAASFADLPRVQTLCYVLRWPGPPAGETRMMEIERNTRLEYVPDAKVRGSTANEYANRPVLPTPADVLGLVDGEEQQQRTQATPQPSPYPAVGAIFTGKILEDNGQQVAIEIPSIRTEKGMAIIDQQMRGMRTYRVGKTARVEVMAQETRKGRVILQVRPAPKKEP
jgi:CRISPR-associated protein (TIGR03986 family)